MIRINVFTLQRRRALTALRWRTKNIEHVRKKKREWAAKHPYRRIRVVVSDDGPQVIIRKPRSKNAEAQKRYEVRHREQIKERRLVRYRRDRINILERTRQLRRRLKEKVLTHYGLNGHLRCCWPECAIVDVEMLTLDHVEGGGNSHRKQVANTYAWVKRHEYPPGFQTLCANHQMKKEFSKTPPGSISVDTSPTHIGECGS